MSDVFDLMDTARRLAETAKDAMNSNALVAPDETSAKLGETILAEAKRFLPDDRIVQSISIQPKLWVSLRSAMEAVVSRIKAANRDSGIAVAVGSWDRSVRDGF